MVKKISLSTITTFNSLLVIVTALLLCLPISAHAGADGPPPEAPMPEASPTVTTQEIRSFGTPVKVFYDGILTTTFFHDPKVSENMFVFQLARYSTASGCAQLQRDIGPIGEPMPNTNDTTLKYINDRLEIMVDMPIPALTDYEPRYANHDCEMQHLRAYSNILLDRDMLIKRKIKKIAVKTIDKEGSTTGDEDNIDVKIPEVDFGMKDIDITKERLIIKSKNEGMREVWTTLWFFPKNSIKLYVPSANANTNVLKEIRDFGLAHGLVPMDEVLEGYRLPRHVNDYVYFVDDKRVFLRELDRDNDSKQLGDVGITKTYHGPKGPQDKVRPLPIYGSLMPEQVIR